MFTSNTTSARCTTKRSDSKSIGFGQVLDDYKLVMVLRIERETHVESRSFHVFFLSKVFECLIKPPKKVQRTKRLIAQPPLRHQRKTTTRRHAMCEIVQMHCGLARNAPRMADFLFRNAAQDDDNNPRKTRQKGKTR